LRGDGGLNVLRADRQIVHDRKIIATILAAKGLDTMDRALTDATVKRMRFAQLLRKREGIVRLLGLQRARSARWAQVKAGAGRGTVAIGATVCWILETPRHMDAPPVRPTVPTRPRRLPRPGGRSDA